MTDRRERLAGVLAVAVVLLAGASLAAGIHNALFDAAPLRAGSFSAVDVADLVTPVEAVEPEPPSTSTTSTTAAPVDPSTTTTAPPRGTAPTTTTTRSVTVTTSSVSPATTASTTTTVAGNGSNRGRSDENRGKGKPADD